jgi:hypothetical protein
MAVNQDDASFQYAYDSLKANREVVLAAVKKDGNALGYASRELQQDEELKRISNQ